MTKAEVTKTNTEEKDYRYFQDKAERLRNCCCKEYLYLSGAKYANKLSPLAKKVNKKSLKKIMALDPYMYEEVEYKGQKSVIDICIGTLAYNKRTKTAVMTVIVGVDDDDTNEVHCLSDSGYSDHITVYEMIDNIYEHMSEELRCKYSEVFKFTQEKC